MEIKVYRSKSDNERSIISAKESVLFQELLLRNLLALGLHMLVCCEKETTGTASGIGDGLSDFGKCNNHVASQDLHNFAVPGWEKMLDPAILSAVSMLAQDHKHCLKRIRASRQPIKERSRQSDITKILFARCQEDDYDTDVLYALFSALFRNK